ncbi:MAG: ERCC4 domain-containing protein [Candidatus Omnitrophica bacterium]|nr:hypothetical protein [bacterium]NUN94531.1 ERCC4 domain-containing protein [Candidatus Omnitrophota bacterium]
MSDQLTPPSITVVRDTREQAPLKISAYPVVVQKLVVGDYGILGFSDLVNPAFIVERKSLDDLVVSLTTERGRFMTEVQTMRRFRFAAVLVEGLPSDVWEKRYRSDATPQSVMASVDCLMVRCGIHMIWSLAELSAARQFERLVRAFVGGVIRDHRLLFGNKIAEAGAVEQKHGSASE